MYSLSHEGAAGILRPVKELQVIFFLWKSCSYSSSYGNAGILLPVEEVQLFFFLWKSSRYYSSYRRAACNFVPIGKMGVFSFK